jgi:hypothetical protein
MTEDEADEAGAGAGAGAGVGAPSLELGAPPESAEELPAALSRRLDAVRAAASFRARVARLEAREAREAAELARASGPPAAAPEPPAEELAQELEALARLARVATSNPAEAQAQVRSGALSAVAAKMALYPGSRLLQAAALLALQALAQSSPDEARRNGALLRRCGAVEAALAAMAAHRGCAPVHLHGLEVLAAASEDPESSVLLARSPAGLGAIVAAMRSAEDPRAAAAAAAAASNLALDNALVVELRAAALPALLLPLMARHATVPCVQANGFSALASLAGRGFEASGLRLDLPAFQQTCVAMERHGDDVAVQAPALAFLFSSSTASAGVGALQIAAGGHLRLLRAMERHAVRERPATDPRALLRIQLFGCHILYSLARASESSRVTLLAAGALRRIADAQRLYPQVPDLQSVAGLALASLRDGADG